MPRITTLTTWFSALGIALTGFSVALWYIFDYVSLATSIPYYTWAVSLGLLILVILMAGVTTFTEKQGFVHPEDKLAINMSVYIFGIANILGLGVQYPGDPAAQGLLFDIASMIVVAYVFLFVFVFFSGTITEGSDTGQVKEMTSRFMLVSLFVGAIMAGVKIGLDSVYVLGYEYAAVILGIFAFVLALLIVLFLGRKYEPVGTDDALDADPVDEVGEAVAEVNFKDECATSRIKFGTASATA